MAFRSTGRSDIANLVWRLQICSMVFLSMRLFLKNSKVNLENLPCTMIGIAKRSKSILVISAYLFSNVALADGGCTSLKTPACLLWFATLIFGSGLLFWTIFLPIFFVLNNLVKLKTRYQHLFLVISYLCNCGLIFLLSSDSYRYFRSGTSLEEYQNYEFWIFVPCLYLFLYLSIYLVQLVQNRIRKKDV
jgi:hypothetical protein